MAIVAFVGNFVFTIGLGLSMTNKINTKRYWLAILIGLCWYNFGFIIGQNM